MTAIFADYHTHTVFSHGRNTPEENVLAAVEKGLKEIAITDHAPSHIFYGVKNIRAYIQTVEDLKRKYAGRIEVLLGLELNIVSLDGTLEADESLLSRLDIALLGYHKAVWYRNIKSAAHFYLKKGRKMDREAVKALNTESYLNALEKNRVDIISHPGYGIPLDHVKLADCCARRGVKVEINASHHELKKEDLWVYRDAGVKFVLSSDAHTARRVGDVKRALLLAEEAGIDMADIANTDDYEKGTGMIL
jgi:putative hydrolase